MILAISCKLSLKVIFTFLIYGKRYLIVFFQQLIVDFEKVSFPFGLSKCIQDSWEVICATVNYLFLFSQWNYIGIDHSTKLEDKFIADF